MRAAFAIAAALAWACAGEARAAADIVDTEDPTLMAPVVLGALGGVATSVAALVYALDDRAFDDGWIVASLFSSSICAAMMVAFAANADEVGPLGTTLGVGLYGLVAAWPAYWTVKTALAEVDPGEQFTAPSVDPFHSLGPRANGVSRRGLVLAAFALEL